MPNTRVTVRVEGDDDIAALVQDHLERNLRFRTKGPTCELCREEERKSDAGEDFEAPPIHRNCDCELVIEGEDDAEAVE